MIFTRSDNVPKLKDYRAYRDPYLRPDFQFRCAYCLIHERFFLETGGGEIDHHRPLNPPANIGNDFSHLKNEYANLYWTCGECNNCKANKWPSDEEFVLGIRFLDPCAEDHQEHWDLMPDGHLQPKTVTGRYTIREIRLNRSFLVRARRHFLAKRQAVVEIREWLLKADLNELEFVKIDQALRDDYLLDPPAFIS
jgi:hypothetical protein